MWMNKYKVSVPEGTSGKWKIIKFSVNKDQAKFANLRANTYRDEIIPGDYTRLTCDQTTVMSDTPMEIRSNRWIMDYASGKILMNGLGIGMVLQALLRRDNVEHVTIIEKYQDVINLVESHYRSMFGNDRFKIIHADALEYKHPKDTRFDYAYHDIWTYICGDNYREMKKLHRKCGRIANAQMSWKRKEVMRLAKGEY